MNRPPLNFPQTNTLVLLIPAIGLALALRATAAPRNLLDHAPVYVDCMVAAWLCFAMGAFWIRRHPAFCSGRLGMALILGAALITRVRLLPVRPTLSTDIYRYLWDGRVIMAGRNPYALPPTAPELAAFGDPRKRHINFPEVRTPYPPVSEAFFALVALCKPDSVLIMKAALGVCELLSLWIMAVLLGRLQRPRADLLLYAWNPLVIAETWLHGHNDCLGVTLLLACLLPLTRRTERSSEAPNPSGAASASAAWSAGAWLGLAAMSKPHALLALPILLPRIGWRGLLMTLAVIGACFLPFLDAGSHLMGGAQEMANWSTNGSLYPLFRIGSQALGLEERFARALCGALLLLCLGLLFRRSMREPMGAPGVYRRLGYALTAGCLVSPVLQPWYLVWIAPFAALTQTASLFIFTGVVTLWYLGAAASALSYVPVYALLAMEGWQSWRKHRSR